MQEKTKSKLKSVFHSTKYSMSPFYCLHIWKE